LKNKPKKILTVTIALILLLSLVPMSGLAVRAPPAKPPFDLMIIAPDEFCTALQPLKAHKDATGIKTEIISLEWIYDKFDGRDEPEKVKRCIESYRTNSGLKYVMLVGDVDKFPVRYCRIYDPTHWGHSYAPSDLYYADLYKSDGSYDDWDIDDDQLYGEMGGVPWQAGVSTLNDINLDQVDLRPDVMVGRIPASSVAEVTTYVNKVISYESNAYESNWVEKGLLLVSSGYNEDENRYEDYPGAWECKDHVASNLQAAHISSIKLYDKRIYDLPSGTSDGNPSPGMINDKMNSGVGFVNYAGHGGVTSWTNCYEANNLDKSFGPTQKWQEYFCIDNEIPAVGDVNGDGKDDIVTFIRDTKTGTGQGDVYVALSTGSSFGAGQKWHEYFCIGNEIPAVGDVNGDGKDDIVTFIRDTKTGTGQGDVYVALSTGSSFGAGQKWHEYFCVSDEVPAVGDFNGNGKDDIITFNRTHGTVWVAMSTGSNFGAGERWGGFFCFGNEQPDVGDWDGDGTDDIVNFVRDSKSGTERGDVYVAFPITLQNANKLPVVFAVACDSAHFHPAGAYLDRQGNAFTGPSVCWPADPNAPTRPEPAAVQRNPATNQVYDTDSMAEAFLVKRNTGGIAYIGCYTGSQGGGQNLDKYFFEGYRISQTIEQNVDYHEAILGSLWNYAISRYIDNNFHINLNDLSDWYPAAGYHHIQKYMLFGDPSLRIGGVPG
jgi:hypothetical protein